MRDIIQGMVDNGMHVEAVGLSCAFKLEDKFPPVSLLSSFIQGVNQTTKKMSRGQGSPVVLKEADEKQLAALKSVIRCVEDHQLDRAKLSSWNIDEKIANLENLKAASKRKADEHVSLDKLKTHKAKHHRPTTEPQRHPLPPPPKVIPSQEKSLLLHDGLSDGGYPGNLSGFSGGTLAGPVGVLSERGLLPAGNFLGAGPSAGSGVIGNGSFPGIGNNNRMGTYSWHGNDSTTGGQSFPSSSMQGFMGANRLLSQTQRITGSNLYQFADTVAQSEAHDSSALYPQAYF
ncbi:uncharacterized protein LOC143856305 [Tasmannia lanceolata]|uniref:uncharacterized protein LOC143856305 n=1 Tax=Tasmannia lanceolata TaxID=3420 RepID=UPI004062D0D5